MRRRTFLSSFAVAGTPSVASPRSSSAKLRINAVEVWRIEGKLESSHMEPRQYQVQPIHIYEDQRPKPVEGDNRLVKSVRNQSRLYLNIKTDAGLEGLYGPIDTEAAIVVHRRLRPFLAGKDPLAGEKLWDQMFRLNRHSRRGHYMMGISAADNALWDLRGRYFNAPVYRLLGGPTRPAVQAYGSCLGHSVAPGG